MCIVVCVDVCVVCPCCAAGCSRPLMSCWRFNATLTLLQASCVTETSACGEPWPGVLLVFEVSAPVEGGVVTIRHR